MNEIKYLKNALLSANFTLSYEDEIINFFIDKFTKAFTKDFYELDEFDKNEILAILDFKKFFLKKFLWLYKINSVISIEKIDNKKISIKFKYGFYINIYFFFNKSMSNYLVIEKSLLKKIKKENNRFLIINVNNCSTNSKDFYFSFYNSYDFYNLDKIKKNENSRVKMENDKCYYIDGVRNNLNEK